MTATNSQYPGLTLRQPPPAAPPPFVVPAEYADIPKELISDKMLLVHRSKVPFGAVSRKAENNPELGATIQEACGALAEGGADGKPLDGLGRYVAPPFVVIDLDKCVDPQTGDVETWAGEIVRSIDSYTESSPSGTGLHIWVRGAKPGDRCRNGIEMYDRGRYLTLTGRHVPATPKEVREVDLTDIYARMLRGDFVKSEQPSQKSSPAITNEPAKIQSEGKILTTRLELLMSGEILSSSPFVIGDAHGNKVEYPSQSECDGALSVLLATKHGGDAEKIDADFRASSLFREKWDEKHGPKTYGQITIASAIAFIKKTSTSSATAPVQTENNIAPKSFVMVSGDNFMSEKIPPRKVIMRTIDKGDAVFYAKSINQIFAWRGLGKTCVGLGLTAAFANGGSFLNFESPEPVNVLYIEGELPAEQMQERWRQIIGKTNGRARLVTIDKQPEHSFPSFATAQGMARVEATLAQCAAEGFPVAVLFLDSVSTLFNIAANDEENWILIQSWLLRLRSQGLCIFFFHHAGKSGLSRSHSKSEDMLDVSIKLDKPDEQEEGILHAVMVFDKARHGISEPATEIKMRPIHTDNCACKHVSGTLIGCRGNSVSWEHEATSASKKARAFEMYAAGASVRKVASELKMSKTVAGRLSVEYSQGVINAPKALEVDA
jgi:hypothetical protein